MQSKTKFPKTHLTLPIAEEKPRRPPVCGEPGNNADFLCMFMIASRVLCASFAMENCSCSVVPSLLVHRKQTTSLCRTMTMTDTKFQSQCSQWQLMKRNLSPLEKHASEPFDNKTGWKLRPNTSTLGRASSSKGTLIKNVAVYVEIVIWTSQGNHCTSRSKVHNPRGKKIDGEDKQQSVSLDSHVDSTQVMLVSRHVQ